MKITLSELINHPVKTINAHRELRYLVAGTTSEGIEFVSFLILNTLAPSLLYFDNSLSFIFGVVSGFVLHKLWTFRGKQQFKTQHQLVGYLTLAGINFVAINVFIGIYVHGLNIPADLAKLLAIATTVVWTYLLSNFVIFRHDDSNT